MFNTDLGKNTGTPAEEMVGEDSTCRCSIVASEDEELDLSHCEVLEIGVDACSRRVLLEVGMQGEITHGYVSITFVSLNDAVTIVEFAGEIAIHSTRVVYVNKGTIDIDVFQWINIHAGGATFEL